MIGTSHLILITCIGYMLCGCTNKAPLTIHDLDHEQSDASRINNLILTKRVVLERGIEKVERYTSVTSKDVTATSRFGRENEIANVECIVTGMREVIEDPAIISTDVFWKSVGNTIDTMSLGLLLEDRYMQIINALGIDYLVISYHQQIDVESSFVEGIAEGFYGDTDREVASTVTLDMNNKRVIDAFEVNAMHDLGVGHAVFIIPLVFSIKPGEDLCHLAGRQAAEAIPSPLNEMPKPVIAVVAAKINPYVVLSAPEPAPSPP
ncbi:MAG: hypothetical protein HKP57_02360 [Halobacteria archaeon]|nr:hypothetical protein [Halobacteria archaeon]